MGVSAVAVRAGIATTEAGGVSAAEALRVVDVTTEAVAALAALAAPAVAPQL